MIFLRISILFLAFYICQRSRVSSSPHFLAYPEILTEIVPTYILQEEIISPRHQQGRSAPGCPEAYFGHPYVYYGGPDRCYLTGIQGPCDTGRILFPQLTSPYGKCACECLLKPEKWNLLSNTNRCIICPHESNLAHLVQIFDKQEKKCYSPHSESNHNCIEGHAIANWTENYVHCLPHCSKSAEPCAPIVGASPPNIQSLPCPDGEERSSSTGNCMPKNEAVNLY